MTSILLSVAELYESYKEWIRKNPQVSSDYETSAKWISYFIAGRINNSHVVSELVYCLSNLLILFNDQIIKNNLELTSKTTVDKIKLWLAVVEYSEVFCELSVQKLWGKTAKWIVVVSIQIFKCMARTLLIYKHKEDIIENPPVVPLDRVKLAKEPEFGEFSSLSFTLKRSGRVVRKIDSSPPLGMRTWKPLEVHKIEEFSSKILSRNELLAESIYISKPLVHLISLSLLGSDTWKPWMISLVMDLTSLQLYKTSSSLTKKQKLQLSKRTVLLLLYLIRSPFYEKHSKDKLNSLLVALSNNLPLAKVICQPLMQYLPFWQSSYFYMWSS